jgi:hypothetical protein
MASYPNKSQFLKNRAIAFAAVFALLIGIGYLVWYHPGDSNAAGGLAVASRGGSGSSWYSTGGTWAYRRQITIDHTKVGGGSSLTNFPVVISVTDPDFKSSGNGGNVGTSDGTDILFTSSDGTTKLSHEIETYASSTGQLVAWVKIPTLSATADTVIYMYYGNASASDQQDIAGTWDSNTKLVYHMDDLTTSTVDDSTSNGNDGTKRAAGGPAETAALVASGQQFTSSNHDYIDGGTASSLDVSDFTVSGWMKFAGTGTVTGFQSLIWKGDGNSDSTFNYFLETNNAGNIRVGYAVSNGFKTLDSTTALQGGAWYYFTGTYATATHTLSLYVNGQLENSAVEAFDPASVTSPLVVGACSSNSGTPTCDNMNGTIDEVHVSDVARSAGWIATEYNNQSNPSAFAALGGRQAQNRLTESAPTPAPASAIKIRGGVKFR